MFIFLITTIIVIFIVIAIIKNKKTKQEPEDNKPPMDLPVKRTRLLTDPEIAFYKVLREILPPEKSITCKCRLEDIMSVEKGSNRTGFRNRIKCRHVDFVIFTPENGYTNYAIELDDSSHEKTKEDDEFKNNLFQKIKMPLIRIKVRAKYNPDELKKTIEASIAK